MKMLHSHRVVHMLWGCLPLACMLLLVLDFTALHDIRNDYISKEILNFLGVTLSDTVPEWTENSREWGYLSVSLILRGVLYFIIFAVFFFLYKRRKLFLCGSK